MPLELLDLDDRRYPDLVEEALRLIPAHAPEWTNHNPSDPGITLIELFTLLTEMLIYRLNRVTPENVLAFLRLLDGPQWRPYEKIPSAEETLRRWKDAPAEERARTVAETIEKLRKPARAVSSKDFEDLAREADPRVARARCLPVENQPGLIRVRVVPGGDPRSVPDKLIENVRRTLEKCCLLTTRVDVQGPALCEVGVRLTLELELDAIEAEIRDGATSALTRFLDPLTWPFGRPVYVSEVYALLAGLPGVRAVKPTQGQDELVSDAKRLVRDAKTKRLVALKIDADELAIAGINDIQT